MSENPPLSLGEQNYQDFAERYAAAIETKPHNAYYERPATLSLLPNVAGLRVLDAGCGPGIYTHWLLDRGAEVVACDVTPKMVEITRQRVGNSADVYCADLDHPLSFAGDGEFDLVVCPLVLDYLLDWLPVFQEFFRVLKAGGILVFSCGNPTADFIYSCQQKGELANYFEVEDFVMEWRLFGKPYPIIKSYRRPLQAILNPLMQAGFMLDKILETQPTESFKRADAEGYEHLMRSPGFICVRSRKLVQVLG